MNNEDKYEDGRFIISTLVSGTHQNRIKWKSTEYHPAHFFNDNIIADEKPKKSLIHNGTFVVEIADRKYELEIYEIIPLDGKYSGTVQANLSVYDSNDNLLEIYEGFISHDFPDDFYGILPLCDAIFEKTKIFLEFSECADERHYFLWDDVTKADKEHPLIKLMIRLMEERRVADFHKCVLNRSFREQILNMIQ